MIEISHRDRLLLSGGKIFLLLTSRNILGEPTFAYLISDRSAMEKLKKDSAAQQYISYPDYGELLMLGNGAPSAATEQQAMDIALKKYSG